MKVPKGTSKYQAAWIVDDGEAGSEKDDDDDDEDDDIDDEMMEEAVSQVPPRSGDLQGVSPCSRMILSFRLAPCKGTMPGCGFPLLNLSRVALCFFGLLDTKTRGCGAAWVTVHPRVCCAT